MSGLSAYIPAACLSTLCLYGATTASAQDRFRILTQQNVTTDASALRVLVVRDNQLSACYTLFIMEPAAAPTASQPVVSATTPADEATQQSIQRIRDASEKRERQLAELKAQFEHRTGRTYETWVTSGTANGNPDPLLLGKYEADRRRIDGEYEHVLRTEIPGSYPYEVLIPGLRTGGFEDTANAIRRAILDPDPTSTMKTMASQLARIDDQLERLLQAPRLAASGPMACIGAESTSLLP